MRHSASFERKWEPVRTRTLTPSQHRQIIRRSRLIADLLTEIAEGDGITGLYARLLTRALVKTDQDLMQEYGEQIAKLTRDEEPGKSLPAHHGRSRAGGCQ